MNTQPQRTAVPLFSTPLFISQLESPGPGVMDPIRSLEFTRVTANNGWKSRNTRVLELSALKSVKERLQGEINAYAFEALNLKRKYEFYITNSWIMRHQKGDFAHGHAHANSLLSGVYYLQTDEQSGPILFSKPFDQFNLFPAFLEFEFERQDVLNTPVWPVLPKDGMLVLFPSHLSHAVEPSQSEKERYCLAFNVFIRGQFGLDSEFSFLELK